MRLILLSLVIISSHCLLAQDENRFRNFQGIKQPEANATFFEGEGYEIFIQQVDNELDEKGIAKIKKKYAVKDADVVTDSVLNLLVLTSTEQKYRIVTYANYYLIPGTEGKSTVLGFVRPLTRDINLERDFVKSHLTGSIPLFVFTPLMADSIDFVGRTIKLGPVCKWMSPHNVQCPDLGQMNWAIFDDLKQAEAYRDTHLQLAKNKNLSNVKEEKLITLKFEGQKVNALRTKFKIQVPKFVMGGSNVLVVYYVTGQVRGKYVTCILSQYTNDTASDRLAPLLSEVLTLDDVYGRTNDERAPESSPTLDSIVTLDQKRYNDRGFVKIEAGVWIPAGNLSRSVGVSPFFGIHFPFVNNPYLSFRIDFIASIFIPQKTSTFKYATKDSVFMTKMGGVGGLFGVLVTRTKIIDNNKFIDYFDQTYSIGQATFQTTTKKPKKNSDDDNGYYSFNTIYFSYGVVLRKKVFKRKSAGLAIRYNFAPTGWYKSEVGQGFGNSSITTSLQLKI